MKLSHFYLSHDELQSLYKIKLFYLLNIEPISYMVKTYYKGAKIVVTLYCFLRVLYLNFNHVIIMKDFHNVSPYYGRSKLK